MYLFLTAYLLLAIPSAAAVLRQKQTPVVAIAWLLAIVLLPIGGSLFYLLAGYRKPVRDVPPTDSRPAAGIERMLWYGCSTRVRYRNRVEQLHDGGEAFAALISALQGARRYIHLSYYIFADDRIGHAIADILVRKARAGVEVRLLYDAIGSWKLSERFVRRLRGAGIEVRAYAPLRFPWFSPRANRRNHSKIAVIDGRTGFVGGINIAERYLDGDALGRWRDEHLRIEGEAVDDLQRLFAADWALEGGEPLSEGLYAAAPADDLPCSPLQIAWTREDRSRTTLTDLFAQLIEEARHTLRISSPYFLPPPALYEALLRAVDGVQRATPYAVKSGIVRTRDAMEGVALKGVDGSYDWSFFAGRLTEGRLPRVGDSLRTKELLLSARTARLLGVHAGDKVEMLFVAGDERPRRDRFKVSGLYSTGMEELERTALTDLRNVQRLSGWSSGEVSGYDLFLGDVRQADRLAEAVNDALLRSDLPETDGVVAVSVGERYPAVFDWLKAHDVNAAVVIAVMVAVAFFNMASALLILVLERTRMIGLLKAMGMENRRIRRIFLYRAAFIVGRGLLWGNLAAGLLCWLQARFHLLRLDPAGYMLSEVPVAVSAGWWLAVDVAAAGAILALLLVPAAFVARIRPDEAIKTD